MLIADSLQVLGIVAQRGGLPPTGAIAETAPRNLSGVTMAAGTSGTLYVCGLVLAAGVVVSNMTMFTGSTAESGGSHGWYALLDNSMTVRAVTADQTGAAAWAAATSVQFAFAATYTTAYAGLYYAGVCITATGMPTFLGAGTAAAQCATAPQILGSSSTGQTTPPVTGTVMAALTAGNLAGTVANFYAWLS